MPLVRFSLTNRCTLASESSRSVTATVVVNAPPVSDQDAAREVTQPGRVSNVGHVCSCPLQPTRSLSGYAPDATELDKQKPQAGRAPSDLRFLAEPPVRIELTT